MDKQLILDNNILFDEVVELLKVGREAIIPVKGSSMMPLIRSERDTVILEGIEGGSPLGVERKRVKPYDIVLFTIDNHYILHRVLSISKDGIATIQGDGNFHGVEHCDLDHIFGKAVTILRDGKDAMNPYTKSAILRFRLWKTLIPIRRYLLWIYRRICK